MSKTFIPKSDLVHGAIGEIQSAISSLNMYPSPIKDANKGAFLSETDFNAKHCVEHLNAAMDILSTIDGIDVDVEKFLRYSKEDGVAIDNVHFKLLKRYENISVQKLRDYKEV